MTPWTDAALAKSAVLKRMLEGEEVKMAIEFNWFGDDPKRHVKLTADSFEELAQLYVEFMAFHADFLAPSEAAPAEEPPDEAWESNLTHAVEPHNSRQPSQPPSPVSVVARPAVRPASSAVTCGLCGGKVYDEHKSQFWGNGMTKNGTRKPDWKCQDKQCGGAAWDEYSVENQYVEIGEWRRPRL